MKHDLGFKHGVHKGLNLITALQELTAKVSSIVSKTTHYLSSCFYRETSMKGHRPT